MKQFTSRRMLVSFPRRSGMVAATLFAVAATLGLTLLSGCGSGGGTVATTPAAVPEKATGKAAFSITWPVRTINGKLIPFAANSIDIRLTSADGTKLYGDTILVRPKSGGTANASFDKVPVGAATLIATAYPNADGTGIAQATAQTPVTVVQGQTANVSLTMATTIQKITVTPPSVALTVGATSPALVATATDASGNVVLFNASTLTWTSAATGIATVDVTGKVTAVAVGTTQITATETESGISSTASVTVSAATTPTGTTSAYEGFAYTAGQGLFGQTGGTGWDAGWYMNGPSTPTTIVANSLTYLNLVTSGGAAMTTSDQPIGNERDLSATVSTPGQVVYLSTLIRFLNITSSALERTAMLQ